MIVTTPQDAAQKVARRAAQMADKVNLEISSVIENMSGFTTPDGQRFPIFGEGGGQRLADELDVPLVGQVPLTMPLRAHADAGIPLVAVDPDDPASQAIRHAARGLIALARPRRSRCRSWRSSRPGRRSRSGCHSRWPSGSAIARTLRRRDAGVVAAPA